MAPHGEAAGQEQRLHGSELLQPMNYDVVPITMIGFEAARRLAQQHVDDSSSPGACVLYPWPTVKSYGWVFSYQATEYLLTGESGHLLAGNATVLVERQTGSLITFGTAHPTEHYLSEYERSRGIFDEADRPKAEASMPVRPSLTDAQVAEVVAALRREFPLAWRQLTTVQQSPFESSADSEVEIKRGIRSLRSRWPFVVQAPEPLWLVLELDDRVLEFAARERDAGSRSAT